MKNNLENFDLKKENKNLIENNSYYEIPYSI